RAALTYGYTAMSTIRSTTALAARGWWPTPRATETRIRSSTLQWSSTSDAADLQPAPPEHDNYASEMATSSGRQAVKAAFAALDGGEFYTDPLIEVPEDVSRA